MTALPSFQVLEDDGLDGPAEHHLPCQGSRPYMHTFSGVQFFIDEPEKHIRLIDIAHHLAAAPRFAGACPVPYSVAEHCWRVSHIVPAEHAKWGLLHDASEAYLCDIPRPWKPMLPEYQALEERLLKAVAERYGLEWPIPKAVKDVDNLMAAAEASTLWSPPPAWTLNYESLAHELAYPEPYQVWSHAAAKQAFINRFVELFEV